MSKRKTGWRHVVRGTRFYALILLVFLVISVVCLHILQNELLKSAQQTGSTLAHSYALDETRSTATYEAILRLGAASLERLALEDADTERVRRWLSGYFEDIITFTGENVIDPYAVLDGRIIAANAWVGDAAYDYAAAEWYQRAIDAGGEVIYTDAYTDAIYDRKVITVAVSCGGSDVLAFDIFPENFQLAESSVALPEGSSYFLCDRNGVLLYAQTEMTASEDDIQAYLERILASLKNGELDAPNSYIYDLDGRQRGVYYSVADNGWFSIITIPYATILSDLLLLTIVFSIIFLLFLAFTVLISIRSYRLSRRVERTNETVRVLGNSYYAIYRVDFDQGAYDMIKGSDYLRQHLPKTGAYQDFLAVAAQVIEEKACQEFIQSFSLDNIRQLVKKRVRDYGGDFLRRFGEEYRWVNVRMLFDESLNQGEVVICFREIDMEKQTQLQQMRLLENALDAARKNEESQKHFFSSMSHDMRTPLNAIISLSELAAASAEDAARTREYLNKINLSSRQLLGLINDILELSRLEQGKLDLNREPFDLKECLNECVGVFLPQAQRDNKSLTLSLDIQDTMVLGDAFRITQIMNNLLSNAVKYSDPGSAITVRARQMESQKYAKYQLIVSDTGRGMSQGFLQKLFEPYEREVRFGARNVSGTGLGMPIVKSLVAQMGGQITVESELGKGSTFTVTLPLETTEEHRFDAAPESSAAAPPVLAGRHILVAEDNEVNMEIATELLSMQGMDITQAWNGREAVERFSESAPGYFDAILMDMQMPEMNGCDAARAIRALDRTDANTVPILAVTANTFAEDIAATTEAGMNVHISKPIDFPSLYQTLAEQISHRSS